MDGASGLAAVASVVTSTVKIAEKVFEIAAVDEQARAVLQTVNQVSGLLRDARTLRRQKSSLMSTFEKRMIDDTFRQTEEAVQQVAGLAERARADMEVSGGKVRVNTRLLFVLRDSPNIHVSLTKLSISTQSLNMAMFMLCGRQSGFAGSDSSLPDKKAPPTYEESQFLSAGRRKNIQRRASALALKDEGRSNSMMSENPLPPEDGRSRSNSMVSEHTLPTGNVQSRSSLMTFEYPFPAANISELAAVDPFASFDKKTVPIISVAEASLESDDLDLEAFSLATGFSPPPTSGQQHRVWSASPISDASEEEFPGLSTAASFTYPPPPQQRHRSHSDVYGIESQERSFGTSSSSTSPPLQKLPSWSGSTGSDLPELQLEKFPSLDSTSSYSPAPQITRSWSEIPGSQVRQLGFEVSQNETVVPPKGPAQSRATDWGRPVGLDAHLGSSGTYSQAEPDSSPAFPAPQNRTGRARSDRWFQVRCE